LSAAIHWEQNMPKPRSLPRRTVLSKATRTILHELLFQPWFLPFKITRAILSLLPPDYRRRMHDYFDDYGCMRCGRSDVIYRSNGMCVVCMQVVFNRLQVSAMRRLKDRTSRRYGKEFVAKANQARKLLRGLYGRAGVLPRTSTRSVKLKSPVLDTFDRFEA